MAHYPPGYNPVFNSQDSNPLTTSSHGFEYIESDETEGMDDRSKMEYNLSILTGSVSSTKESLVYSTNESVEETTMNVGPQTQLENEILKKIDWLKRTASTDDDTIPRKVLEKIMEVSTIAKEGNASTFTASTSLDATMDAFKYGRDAARDNFTLEREAKRNLAQYDEIFLGMIQSQIELDVDQAVTKNEECFCLLEEAKNNSKTDEARLLERQTREQQQVDLQGLEAIHTAANQELLDEETEYTDIKGNCQKDISYIDRSLGKMDSILDSTTRIHGDRSADRSQKLAANRQEQNDLREQLKRLEAEEREYRRIDREEEKMMETVRVNHGRARTELAEWRSKIAMLERQASASLKILEVMKACTDDILRDAKARKKQWENKLREMELESLLITRDVLVATYCLHKMEVEDCARNLKDAEEDIEKNKKEMQDAAKRRYAEKVNDLRETSQKLIARKESYAEKLANHRAKMEEMNDEIASSSGRIRDLDIRMSLLSVDNVYDRRVAVKESCFEKESVEDARNQLHSCSS